MNWVQRASVLTAVVAVGAASPASLDVALPKIPGFQIGSQQQAGRAVMVELVPTGQTVQRYTKMITLVTTPGAGRMSSGQFVGVFARRYVASCPGSRATPVPMGKGVAGVRIDCSRHPKTGKAETVFARALPVGPDMAMVQYMTTYMTMPAEAQFARNYLGSVTLR